MWSSQKYVFTNLWSSFKVDGTLMDQKTFFYENDTTKLMNFFYPTRAVKKVNSHNNN